VPATSNTFNGGIQLIGGILQVSGKAITAQGNALATSGTGTALLADSAGSTAINWLSWMAGSLFGIFLTQFIPVQWGLGFAGFLALLGIALSLVTTQLRFLAASLSAVLAIGLIELPFNLIVLFGILISIAICDQLALYRSRAVDLKG
jgi:hypothetical protein